MHSRNHSDPIRPAGQRRTAHPMRSAAAAIFLVLSSLGASMGASPASAGQAGMVRGEVVAAGTGDPVAGATITLPAFGARARSDSNGAFTFTRTLLTTRPYRRISARVIAPGFGPWTISGVPLYPNDTLILRAELGVSSVSQRFVTPQERQARGPVAFAGNGGGATGRGSLGATGSTCTGWDYQLVPPPTIRVYLSEKGTVDNVGFYFYASHVLPSEWIPSWDADALAAGAIAVKTYAAYKAMSGHARTGGANCYDVLDTVSDQVYNPAVSYDSTDRAVAAALGSVFYRDGGLFLAQYYAGPTDAPCAPVTGTYAGRMSQWGTQNCAKEGKVWPSIVTTFYTGYTTWNYLRNILLNPSASAPAMYMWVGAGPSDIKRTEGNGADGSWYLTLRPTAPRANATMYQTRPYPGLSSTQYGVTTNHREGADPASDRLGAQRREMAPLQLQPVQVHRGAGEGAVQPGHGPDDPGRRLDGDRPVRRVIGGFRPSGPRNVHLPIGAVAQWVRAADS
jgi:stage II sporulation SpoD-like protein/carboxypeptidase family protein